MLNILLYNFLMIALCAAAVHSLLCVNHTIVESKTVLRQARCYARVQSFIYYRIVFANCILIGVYICVLITDMLCVYMHAQLFY
jgi:hypothetical protein